MRVIRAIIITIISWNFGEGVKPMRVKETFEKLSKDFYGHSLELNLCFFFRYLLLNLFEPAVPPPDSRLVLLLSSVLFFFQFSFVHAIRTVLKFRFFQFMAFYGFSVVENKLTYLFRISGSVWYYCAFLRLYLNLIDI